MFRAYGSLFLFSFITGLKSCFTKIHPSLRLLFYSSSLLHRTMSAVMIWYRDYTPVFLFFIIVLLSFTHICSEPKALCFFSSLCTGLTICDRSYASGSFFYRTKAWCYKIVTWLNKRFAIITTFAHRVQSRRPGFVV